MPLENIIERTADISLVEWQTEPVVMMNDDITFVFTIQKDGLAYPLTNVTKAALACTRRDGKTIVTSGTPDVAAGTVTFDIGRKETAVDGRTQMVIQLYDDLQNRVSTIRGTMYVQLDPTGDTYVPFTEELTLIEEVLYGAPPIIEAAQTATLGAIQAKDEADEAVSTLTGAVGGAISSLNSDKAAALQEMDDKKIEVDEFLGGKSAELWQEQDVRADAFLQSQNDREQTFDIFEVAKEAEFQTFKTEKNDEVQSIIVTADNKINEVEKVAADNKIVNLSPVDTIALRNSTYPYPQNGSVVNVLQGTSGLAETYRFKTGTGWILIDKYNATTISNVTALLADKAKQTDLEIERARISGLVANAGNTDGNAELLDIRVGFDGITYPTAGDATRALGSYMVAENESWGVI